MSFTFVQRFFSLLCLSIIVSLAAQAVEFEYYATAPSGNHSAGKLEELYAYYNSSTKVFQWRTEFSPQGGVLPDGYWLAVNNGPNPKAHAGELALLYADFTDVANPVLTAYAYNGANGFTSFKVGCIGGDCAIPGITSPDRIQSSLLDPGLVISFNVDDTSVPGNRIIDLKINAYVLSSHNPLNPDPEGGPWYGLGFDTKLGYWFHPVSAASFQYCTKSDPHSVCQDLGLDIEASEEQGETVYVQSNGFLKTFTFGPHGWYDKSNLNTNTVPHCAFVSGNSNVLLSDTNLGDDSIASWQSESAYQKKVFGAQECLELEIGKTFNASVVGSDADGDLLTVSYSGLPVGSTITPPDGTKGEPPVKVDFSWTPALSDGGSSYFVDIAFNDGLSQISCPLPICVPEDLPPVCDLEITSGTQCAGPEEPTVVRFSAAKSTDPEGGELFYQWATDCEDNQGQPIAITPLGAGGEAEMVFMDPGLGIGVDCNVSVTVYDMFEQNSTCTVPVEIEPCQFECLPSEKDDCGVCFGPGENCCAEDNLECDPCDQSIVRDACDVCNGPGVDECGTCDGSIITDQCGVCGGDGTNCLGCSNIDISGLQFEMDGNAHEQLQRVRQAIRILKRRGTRPKANKKFSQSIWSESEALYDQSWLFSWSIPSIIQECENSLFCVEVSHVTEISGYAASADQLFVNARKTVRRVRRQIKRASGKSQVRYGRQVLLRAKKAREKSLNLLEQVPTGTSACTTGG